MYHVEACPGWARRVETLDPFDAHSDPDFAAEAADKLLPLLDAGADRIVLGCTHYNFLSPLLEPLIAGRAELVDVEAAVARQVARLASHKAQGSGRLCLLATASGTAACRTAGARLAQADPAHRRCGAAHPSVSERRPPD